MLIIDWDHGQCQPASHKLLPGRLTHGLGLTLDVKNQGERLEQAALRWQTRGFTAAW